MVLIGMLIFATIYVILAIIFVAFYAISFNLFDKIAVIAVALIVATAILRAMWVFWGIKYGREWKQKEQVKDNWGYIYHN